MAVLDNHHAADAFDGNHLIQSRLHIADGLDEIGGQGRRGIRQGGILGNHGGQIALAQAQRVAHFSRR